MSNSNTILKSSFCLLAIAFFLGSCAPTPGKTERKTHTVEIIQMRFQPAELTLKKGDTVVWINRDIVEHDVTEEKGRLWTSGPLAPGGSWSSVVTQNADYFCSIHVVMKGKLIVEQE